MSFPFPAIIPGGEPRKFAYSFLDKYTKTGTTTTETFAGVDLGRANKDRYIVLLGGRRGTNITISSITIGGVPATIISGTGWNYTTTSFIAYAKVPAGTSGNIVMTKNSTSTCGIAFQVVRIVHPTLMPTSMSFNRATGGGTVSGTRTGVAGGVILGVCATESGGSSTRMTWSNATKIDWEFANSHLVSFGYAPTPTSGSRTISVSPGGGAASHLALAVFY